MNIFENSSQLMNGRSQKAKRMATAKTINYSVELLYSLVLTRDNLKRASVAFCIQILNTGGAIKLIT